jgi:hypothetical protein
MFFRASAKSIGAFVSGAFSLSTLCAVTPALFALLVSILLLSERCPLPMQKALRSLAALVAEIERRARFLTTTCLCYLIVANCRNRRFTIQPYTSAEVPPANI